MPSKAWVIVAPRLRIARILVGEALLSFTGGVEGVLLPYPLELEPVLQRFVRGSIEWEEFLREVKEKDLLHTRSWLWIEEPLIKRLRLLRDLGIKLEVECYGLKVRVLTNLASELLRLTLRARLKGRVELECWRDMLSRRAQVVLKDYYITISSSELRDVQCRVLNVWRYPLPPSEELSLSNLSEESVMRYVSYIFDYVATSVNVDEAYLKWLEEQGLKDLASQLRSLLSASSMRSRSLESRTT